MTQTANHTVRLISITPDAEKLVAYCARVSNPTNQHNHDTAPKLLKYLIDHQHWSPFEMANMVVEIKTNRAIAAQILRHRSFSFQEFSQRYAAVQERPGLPMLRRQDVKNRQNSIDDLDEDTKWYLQDEIDQVFTDCFALYQKMLDMGVAKECAREVLPMASETTLYMNGTLRSWMHYIDLRGASGTQLEHCVIAEGCRELLKENCPGIYEAMWP
jgi:thymidylate synthase (FAD)